MSNAAKYTPPGGIVRLGVKVGENEVLVSVSDTGVGIPPDVGDQIFEAFYRVKGNATQRGEHSSGLGLAVTKKLAEALDGRIECESVLGEGTRFMVALRRVPPIEGSLKPSHADVAERVIRP